MEECSIKEEYRRISGPGEVLKGFKLLRRRADGSLGPLFINRKQVVPVGVWLAAESHPTPGYRFRPYWHVMIRPDAPHLTTRGRVWCRVEVRGVHELTKPVAQGGVWWLADEMKVMETMEGFQYVSGIDDEVQHGVRPLLHVLPSREGHAHAHGDRETGPGLD